ncbi:hypothetical protein HN018_09540 [Lichenicola cladoniae]|uniref:Uncharacterized protein n=1 Tax=Lichenicola cladoniae TaxID=1484109 RepID=A0A6M8HPS8_9PROT|nr:hypothetical protein [Lichenicola cladoniae]QKE90251.1 hypothetical protein HN018_09540 [Lichenicola cladoniae]
MDRQVDLLTFTDKGYELAAKQHTDTALNQLVSSAKVSFDQASRKITFENLMTANAVGVPPSLISVGSVIDTSDPRPAFRTKISIPRLAGRLPPMTLFVGESVTLTIDIRPRIGAPPSPSGAAAHDFATAAAPRGHDFATAASPSRAGSAGTSSGGNPPQVASDTGGRAWWDRPGVLVPGAAILVLGVLATNIITWGADAEVDPAALAVAGGMWSRAFAH